MVVLKERVFSRLFSPASLCLWRAVALAEELGSGPAGGFGGGGEEEEGSPAPAALLRSPALHPSVCGGCVNQDPPSPSPSCCGGGAESASDCGCRPVLNSESSAMSVPVPPRSSESLPQHRVSSVSVRPSVSGDAWCGSPVPLLHLALLALQEGLQTVASAHHTPLLAALAGLRRSFCCSSWGDTACRVDTTALPRTRHVVTAVVTSCSKPTPCFVAARPEADAGQ